MKESVPLKRSAFDAVIKIGFYVCSFLAILMVSQHSLWFEVNNPAWGDIVSMPGHTLNFSEYFSMWRDVFLGSPGGTYIPHILLSQFTGFISPHWLQIIMLNIHNAFLFGGLIYISHRFLPAEKKLERNLYPVLFFYLFYTSSSQITNAIQGQFDLLLTYSLAFVCLFLLIDFWYSSYLRTAILLVLFITISVWASWFSLFYFLLFIFPFLFTLIILSVKNKRKAFLYMRNCLLILAGSIVCSLNVLLQAVIPIVNALHFVQNPRISTGNTVIYQAASGMYSNATSFNSLFIRGNVGDISHIIFDYPTRIWQSGAYFDSLLIIYPLLLLLILLSVSHNWLRKKEAKRISLALLGALLFHVGIVLMLHSNIFGERLFSLLPFLHLYRNPKKFLLSIEFLYLALLFWEMRSWKTQVVIIILSVTVLIQSILYFPFLTNGYWGRLSFDRLLSPSQNRDTTEKYLKADVNNRVDRFIQLRDELGQQRALTGRFIILPNNSQTLYESFLRYEIPLAHLSSNNDIYNGLEGTINPMHALYSKMLQGRSIQQEVDLFNVQYIVIDKHSPTELWSYPGQEVVIRNYYTTWLWGNPLRILADLERQSELTKIRDDEEFAVFLTMNTSGMIYARSLINASFQETSHCTDVYQEISNADNNSVYDTRKISDTEYRFMLDVEEQSDVEIVFSQLYSRDWVLQKYQNGRFVDVSLPSKAKHGFVTSWRLTSQEKASSQSYRVVYRWQALHCIVSFGSLLFIVILILLFIVESFYEGTAKKISRSLFQLTQRFFRRSSSRN